MIGLIRDQKPEVIQGSETGNQEAADLRPLILRRGEFGWEGVLYDEVILFERGGTEDLSLLC
jgi:hypothetical protein